MASSGPAVAAGAAHDVTLAGDQVADAHVAHTRTHGDDLAAELVADDERRRDGAGGPVVPRLDVQVGAADAGAQHPDQHI